VRDGARPSEDDATKAGTRMRELLERLSALDGDASSAVKIILHFDTLLGRGAGLESFLRGAAVLSGCPAGLADEHHRIWLRIDEHGRSIEPVTDHRHILAWPHQNLDEGSEALVWIERETPSENDAVLLDRLAAAVHLTLERVSPLSIEDDAGAVEILLSTSSEDARRKAARRLRLNPAATARVVASNADAPSPFARRSAVLSTPHGRVRASIVETVTFSTPGIMGVGQDRQLHDLPESWVQAQVALRLASNLVPIVRWEALGGLALLAHVPPDVATTHRDVVAVRDSSRESWGLDTLEALARTDSIRAASAVLGLHHSTVQTRQARLEELMGFKLGTADGRTRLMVAVTLHRLGTSTPSTT